MPPIVATHTARASLPGMTKRGGLEVESCERAVACLLFFLLLMLFLAVPHEAIKMIAVASVRPRMTRSFLIIIYMNPLGIEFC